VLCDSEVRGIYHKIVLPTYDGFDEARTFAPGQRPDALWRIGDAIAGISICEDMWSGDGPPEAQAAAGAQLLLVPNASPFDVEKPRGRARWPRRWRAATACRSSTSTASEGRTSWCSTAAR